MTRSSPIPALIPERRLRARVRAIGRAIQRDYRGRDLVLVGILKGSFIFMSDLVRSIRLPLRCDFMKVSSYGTRTQSSGRLRFDFDVSLPLRGRHVVVVEDIVDTGFTILKVLAALRGRRPASLRLCALLHKPARGRYPVTIDYLGFTIPDRFVVGYGLDHDGLHRNLPYIGAVDEGPREKSGA
ncbi:MAG TPA: hypoxanthine phosphoribosyltransferase [Planctomycetota bacterium]|nr:hypoxanthine phosphoribosyltransferase [Planctomycetota bacterium]